VVATSTLVGSTRARLAKVAALAELLARLAPDEVEATVALLAGEPRQGKVGVGWATVHAVLSDVQPAAEPSVTVLDLDTAVDRRSPSGAGRAPGAGDRGGGRVHPPAPARRAAPGRAGGRDG